MLFVLLYVYVLFANWREWRYYKANATPLVGWIVQANTALYSRGTGDRPVQVLIAFDTKPGKRDKAIAQLATRVAALKGTKPEDPIESVVAELVNDESYKPFQRFLIPAEFSGGREVYSFHVWVERSMLPEQTLQHPYIRCLVMKDKPDMRVVMDEYRPEDDE
ncbi:MAG: hypothetical protein K2V38_04325 [Gemmataceae bacterium]|nr:hypothetical protein [Gemmataceae bacterium]